MKILVVGCGKVGRNIAEELVAEKHDIVLVDSDESVVQDLSTSLDVLGVIGDAVSLSTLKDAGVENADVLLAVTSSDEVNMLCCLFARKANPEIKTIARVRNPIYAKEVKYIKDELGLTLIINPEMATAREIARTLRFPAATKVEHFSRGRVELASFEVGEDSVIANKKVMDVAKIFNFKVLFVGLERAEEVFIAHGGTLILPGDKVSVIARPGEMSSFFNYLGLIQNPIKNAMLCGGSTIAYYLAQTLIRSNINVKIIERDKNKCEQLADLLPEATIINGDATDHNLLIEEGINNVGAFISLTNLDEENIMLSLFSKATSKAKVITKANHLSFDSVMSKLDVGSVVYPKHITAENIITYVRGLSNASTSNNITALYRILDNKAEVMTFKIVEESEVTKKTLKELNIIDNLLVCAIVRDEEVITPSGSDQIKVGDLVLIATTNKGIDSIEGIIK